MTNSPASGCGLTSPTGGTRHATSSAGGIRRARRYGSMPASVAIDPIQEPRGDAISTPAAGMKCSVVAVSDACRHLMVAEAEAQWSMDKKRKRRRGRLRTYW